MGGVGQFYEQISVQFIQYVRLHGSHVLGFDLMYLYESQILYSESETTKFLHRKSLFCNERVYMVKL